MFGPVAQTVLTIEYLLPCMGSSLTLEFRESSQYLSPHRASLDDGVHDSHAVQHVSRHGFRVEVGHLF